MTDQPKPPDLRVSDEQREQAAKAIRDHFAAGRLDDEELGERLSAVYRAKTEQELRSLSEDLPVSPPQLRAAHIEKRAELRRRLLQETGGGLAPFLVTTAIWAAGGASGFFWPIWILLIVLIPLIRGAWALYGPAPQLDQIERHLERRERHREHHRQRALDRHDPGYRGRHGRHRRLEGGEERRLGGED